MSEASLEEPFWDECDEVCKYFIKNVALQLWNITATVTEAKHIDSDVIMFTKMKFDPIFLISCHHHVTYNLSGLKGATTNAGKFDQSWSYVNKFGPICWQSSNSHSTGEPLLKP